MKTKLTRSTSFKLRIVNCISSFVLFGERMEQDEGERTKEKAITGRQPDKSFKLGFVGLEPSGTLYQDGPWCVQLTLLTLVCKVIRYRLVQV